MQPYNTEAHRIKTVTPPDVTFNRFGETGSVTFSSTQTSHRLRSKEYQNSMKRVFSALCFLCALSGLAAAQTADDYKKAEFFAGLSIVGLDAGGPDRDGLKGFEGSGVYNVSRYFGIKGDFSAGFAQSRASFAVTPTNTVSFDNHQRLLNFLGGIQIKDNSNTGRFKPFGHALIGVGQNRTRNDNFQCTGSCDGFFPGSVSKTGLAAAFGGGLDLRINDRFQVRMIQVDYNPVKGFFQTQHNIRVSAGIVF